MESILIALHSLTFHYRTYGSQSAKGYGSFLGEWSYIGRGKGGHGDGHYILDVQPGFLGCLRVFESTTTRLSHGREIVCLDFAKDLSQDERKELKKSGGYITFDAGRPFYNAAAGLTPSQERLARWMEHQLTKNRDSAQRENRREHIKRNAPEANCLRHYDSRFCPLLPCGRLYYGALGHFRRNPETGFTLGGTLSSLSRRVNGLLAEMGYMLPPGPWSVRKEKIISSALGDLKAVVVEYCAGVVAGYVDGKWIPIEDFQGLSARILCHKLKLLCFIPEDYGTRHRAHFEETTGYIVTDSVTKAEAAFEVTGPNGHALKEELADAMSQQKLTGTQVAAIFGVTRMTVSRWLRGEKPVSRNLVPLVRRWIKTSIIPSADEIARHRLCNPSTDLKQASVTLAVT